MPGFHCRFLAGIDKRSNDFDWVERISIRSCTLSIWIRRKDEITNRANNNIFYIALGASGVHLGYYAPSERSPATRSGEELVDGNAKRWIKIRSTSAHRIN